MLSPSSLEQTIQNLVREEWGRILASLVKTLGDIQLAEDCLQEAVISALQHWGKNGLPRSPDGWLITVAKRKAIDVLRRQKTASKNQAQISFLLDLENQTDIELETEMIADKRLEMIFTCCHPAIEEKSKVALTLRTLGGLTTDEIAHAFLDKPDAMAQRLVRAKKKIKLAGIPYEIPSPNLLPERISSILRVIYLIFNEGYSATQGSALTRSNLSDEAIRLARIVNQLMPNEPEVIGLLALMLIHDSRRIARVNSSNEMVSLENQNRNRWNKSKIAEGSELVKTALPMGRIGPYQLQAAISALHGQSPSWHETDWPQISQLYALLYAIEKSPVVRINQAVAISYAQSPQAGLELLDDILQDASLQNYQPYFAARADLLLRSGDKLGAKENMQKAIDLTDNKMEHAFLTKKAASL